MSSSTVVSKARSCNWPGARPGWRGPDRMSWSSSPHSIAEAYDLDLEELLAMADYLEVDVQKAAAAVAGQHGGQQGRGVLEAVAQAAVYPLAEGWGMYIAQGGKMYACYDTPTCLPPLLAAAGCCCWLQAAAVGTDRRAAQTCTHAQVLAR